MVKGKLYLRGKTWWMRYTHRGQEVRQSCQTESQAEAESRMEVALAKVHITGMVPPRDVLLESLVRDYLADCVSTDRGGIAKRGERYWSLHLQPYFQKARISTLGTADFVKYRQHRLTEGAAQASLNRELQILIAAFKHGYRSTPPTVERLPYIKLTKENNARKVFITEAQRDALLAAASKEKLEWRVFLEIAWILGWRRSEIYGLHVRNIDIVDRVIRIEDSKNGDPREVPMTERLSRLIQQLISDRGPEDRVFPLGMTGGGFNRIWKRIRAVAGCPNVKLHDYRRSSARTKRAAGVPESVVMEIQGWRTSAMFRRYCIVDNTDKRKALEMMDRLESYRPHKNPHNQA